jgi:hypothetical protein
VAAGIDEGAQRSVCLSHHNQRKPIHPHRAIGSGFEQVDAQPEEDGPRPEQQLALQIEASRVRIGRRCIGGASGCMQPFEMVTTRRYPFQQFDLSFMTHAFVPRMIFKGRPFEIF